MSQFAAPLFSLHFLPGLQALHRALDEAEVQKNALGTQLQAIRREDEQSRAAYEVSTDACVAAWQGLMPSWQQEHKQHCPTLKVGRDTLHTGIGLVRGAQGGACSVHEH